jgi:hypothetical protein
MGRKLGATPRFGKAEQRLSARDLGHLRSVRHPGQLKQKRPGWSPGPLAYSIATDQAAGL